MLNKGVMKAAPYKEAGVNSRLLDTFTWCVQLFFDFTMTIDCAACPSCHGESSVHMVNSLPRNAQGRPLLLGQEIDKAVQE